MGILPNAQHLLSGTPSTEHEQAQSEALFLSIGDGAIATDEKGRIQRINQVALDILGLKEKDVIDKWFPHVIPARDEDGKQIELIDLPVSQALLTGHPVSSKCQYETKRGALVPVFMTVAPVLLAGRPVGAIEVFRDITHEQEIDRMKSEFISIASHQLRTPLTAIKTYSHMLAGGFRGHLTPEQQEFMEIILTSIDRMNELISTLLDITRIEEGILSTASQMVPTDDLIRELITELQPMVDAKKIDLNFVMKGRDFTLNTDPTLLREVIANLLSNAIKYTPAGGKIEIMVTEKAKKLLLTVEDTGYGIPRGQHKRVFTKFFRADNIMNKDAAGTGLGLYLVRRIADNLNGSVWFISREDHGSTFYFEIPKA